MVYSFYQSYQKDGQKQEIKDHKHATTPVEIIKKDVLMDERREKHDQQKCDLPHFKQLTRVIIESFPTPGKRHTTIQLSDDDLKMLQEFKDDTEGEKISDVLQLVIGIFTRISDDERLHQTFFTRILARVEYHKEIFAVVLIISVLIFTLIIFETRTAMSWYKQCFYLFGIMFMVSIPWEWFRLYQKEYAEKQAHLMKSNSNQCLTRNMTITERVSLWVTGFLSWNSDECIKYQEAILVDPIWEVSPSVVSTQASIILLCRWRKVFSLNGQKSEAVTTGCSCQDVLWERLFLFVNIVF